MLIEAHLFVKLHSVDFESFTAALLSLQVFLPNEISKWLMVNAALGLGWLFSPLRI